MGDGLAAMVLRTAATTAQDLALAWLIGTLLLRRWIAVDRLDAVVAGRIASVVLCATQPLLMWIEAAVMGDVALRDALPLFVDVVRSTHFGAVWAVGLVVALGLLATGPRSSAVRDGWTSVLLVAFAVTRSLLGHAAAAGDLRGAVALDATHLLLTGAWVGEVLVAAFVVLPRLDAADAFVASLSRSATAILAGVLATGFARAWLAVGSPRHLFDTAYGAVLVAKLALVIVAIALAAFNRFVVMPTVDGRGPRRFIGILRFEAVALAAATAAAAVLIGLEPPAGG